ncbi:GRAM domain-containing protein 2B [Lingula anatina]|uniref:GRAM domain-containing protein 2B n=1 Tax=Lingula anatina TaxID=7574 RepID=A0A1S3HYY7_LINAN|nr:GRAM domain-containing protein 2B [Lingula anatina]|eukprot:XP_013391237.1 GRAM domain-containing protein 2B [Lingula anatina]
MMSKSAECSPKLSPKHRNKHHMHHMDVREIRHKLHRLSPNFLRKKYLKDRSEESDTSCHSSPTFQKRNKKSSTTIESESKSQVLPLLIPPLHHDSSGSSQSHEDTVTSLSTIKLKRKGSPKDNMSGDETPNQSPKSLRKYGKKHKDHDHHKHFKLPWKNSKDSREVVSVLATHATGIVAELSLDPPMLATGTFERSASDAYLEDKDGCNGREPVVILNKDGDQSGARQSLDRSKLTLDKDLLEVPTLTQSGNRGVSCSAPATPDLETVKISVRASAPDLMAMKKKKADGSSRSLENGEGSVTESTGSLTYMAVPRMSRRRNQKFHRLFPDIPHNEHALNYYSCALVSDILIPGSLYVSENWVCFHSKLFGQEKQIIVSFSNVSQVTRERTAFIIPNAIGISTVKEKHVFGSLMSRDSTYKFLTYLWKNCKNQQDPAEINETVFADESFENPEEEESSLDITEESDFDLKTCEQCGVSDCGHVKLTETNQSKTIQPVKAETVMEAKSCTYLRSPYKALYSLFQSIWALPRLHFVLVVCSLLALFLLVSGAVLTYKIFRLQAKIEGSRYLWHHQHSDRGSKYFQDAYYLQTEYHAATVDKLHSVLRANVKLLDEMHLSLKSLQDSSGQTCRERVKADNQHGTT